jgi:hypothetical protein
VTEEAEMIPAPAIGREYSGFEDPGVNGEGMRELDVENSRQTGAYLVPGFVPRAFWQALIHD